MQAQHGYPVDNKQPYPPLQPMMTQVQYPPGNYPQQYPSQQPLSPQVYGVDATTQTYETSITPQPTYPIAQVLRDWHRDICCCFNDVPFCLLTMVLPCLSHCIVAKKAKFQQIFIVLIFLYCGLFGTYFLAVILIIVADKQEHKELAIMEAHSVYIPKDSSPSPYYQYAIILSISNGIIGLQIAIFLVIMRIMIRKSRNIAGTCLGDWGWTCHCCCCATCQQYEELNFAGEDDTVQRC